MQLKHTASLANTETECQLNDYLTLKCKAQLDIDQCKLDISDADNSITILEQKLARKTQELAHWAKVSDINQVGDIISMPVVKIDHKLDMVNLVLEKNVEVEVEQQPVKKEKINTQAI